VDITDYKYTPDTIMIAAGTPVRWTNHGAFTHTVTADGSAFNSGNLGPPGTDSYGHPTAGATYDRTFDVAGTYPYHCAVHTFMHGVVIVSP